MTTRMVAEAMKLKHVEPPVPEEILPLPLVEGVLCNRAWSEQQCFIVGGGASLKEFDFESLKGEYVIACNRAYEALPEAQIIYFIDGQFQKDVVAGIYGAEAMVKWISHPGLKVTQVSRGKLSEKGIVYSKYKSDGCIGSSLSDGLWTGGNTGCGALALAICLGANPIYLLGFDCYGKDGDQAWYHSGHPKKQPESVYDLFIKAFEQVTKAAKTFGAHQGYRNGLRIVNLNRKSRIQCFEFGDIKTVLKARQKDVFFEGCQGFGDNLYQRPVIKALAKRHRTVYVKTCFPEAYWDIENVRFVYPGETTLHTQNKHVAELPKRTWSRVPKLVECRKWSQFPPAYHIEQYWKDGKSYKPQISTVSFLRRAHGIWDMDFSFPMKREWMYAAKRIYASLELAGKELCIIRPPTLRKEWFCSARNPKLEYFQLLIDQYKDKYFFLSIADIAEGKEWLVGELSGINKKYHHGELPLTTVFGLMKLAAMTITYPSLFMVAGIALRAKTFCIFGGMQPPGVVIDKSMGLEQFGYVAPEPFCECMANMTHDCNKDIAEKKIFDAFEELQVRTKPCKTVSVGVPPGMGDMHWIMTKMESFKEKNRIDKLIVSIFEDCGHQMNAQYLEMLPFVDEVKRRKAYIPFSFQIAGGHGRPIYENEQGENYLIEFNSELERGKRLETILPEYNTNWNYPMTFKPEDEKRAKEIERAVGGKMVLCYTSCVPANEKWATDEWRLADWIGLIDRIYDKTNHKVVLLGAKWDTDYTDLLMKECGNKIINLVAQTNIGQVLALIRHAKAFVSYPSGLSVMAIHFGIPCVMFFPIEGVSKVGQFKPEFMKAWIAPNTDGKYMPIAYGAKDCNVDSVFEKVEAFL